MPDMSELSSRIDTIELVGGKKKTTERLEFSKFCNSCRKHTKHRETK